MTVVRIAVFYPVMEKMKYRKGNGLNGVSVCANVTNIFTRDGYIFTKITIGKAFSI